MADEIDDLLDEVEQKFCSKKRTNCGVVKKIRKPVDGDEDLNQIIDDICDLPLEKQATNLQVTGDQTACGISPRDKKKCFAVYLSGSSTSEGLSNSLSKRPCNSLRCTACDFKVSSFDNMEWTTKTDYLFLRNNVPDFHKLRSRLISKKGSRAYCCQCSWKSVTDLSPLQDPDFRWVCGKH